MDWSIQDLGALGEFVGSIGVIATLIESVRSFVFVSDRLS
jgi:hypothetical protein